MPVVCPLSCGAKTCQLVGLPANTAAWESGKPRASGGIEVRTVSGLILTLVVSCACTSANTAAQVRDQARQLQSLAAEAELFTQFVDGGHSTVSYANAHSQY